LIHIAFSFYSANFVLSFRIFLYYFLSNVRRFITYEKFSFYNDSFEVALLCFSEGRPIFCCFMGPYFEIRVILSLYFSMKGRDALFSWLKW
jgi:hypothetical protein